LPYRSEGKRMLAADRVTHCGAQGVAMVVAAASCVPLKEAAGCAVAFAL